MLDFAAVPPEINSARMYSGPGSGPMLAAAAAWDALAIELSSVATGYGSVVSELAGTGWRGPASLSMVAAAAPHVAWLHSTAARAEQTAVRAKEAAAAYEVAFAMIVPPQVIVANRSLLLVLVATNFFGQNTPAIAATEAHYAEMWLQDAAAMYGYVGNSAAASQLTPFNPPPSTTDPSGLAGQSGAVAHAVSKMTLVDILEHVPNVTNTVLSTSNAVASGRGIFALNARLAFQEAQEAQQASDFGTRLVSTAPVPVGRSAVPAVSAAMGRATLAGSLSVPPTWATAAPEIRTVALALPESGGYATSASAAEMAPVLGSAFSQSVLGTLSRHGFHGSHPKSKPIIVRSPAAG